MNNISPYNPLDKLNLARSIEGEILKREADSLTQVGHIIGAGVYVLYYTGPFSAYKPISEQNKDGILRKPIYVGKAIPEGGRKGGLSQEASAVGKPLAKRLSQHKSSISQTGLAVEDFWVRYLILDDIWIPLGENMLIQSFRPIWNGVLDGFGNNTPGKRRATQVRSPWDTVHPGRKAFEKCTQAAASPEFLIQRIDDYLAGKPVAKLPKVLIDEQDEELAESTELADNL